MSLLGRPKLPPDLGLELRLAEWEAHARHAAAVIDAVLFKGRAATRQDLVDALLDIRHTLAPTGGGGDG